MVFILIKINFTTSNAVQTNNAFCFPRNYLFIQNGLKSLLWLKVVFDSIPSVTLIDKSNTEHRVNILFTFAKFHIKKTKIN